MRDLADKFVDKAIEMAQDAGRYVLGLFPEMDERSKRRAAIAAEDTAVLCILIFLGFLFIGLIQFLFSISPIFGAISIFAGLVVVFRISWNSP